MTDLTDNHGRPYVSVETDEFGNTSYLREDGDYDVPLELSTEVIAKLALIAHNRDMKLNDLIVEIVKQDIEAHVGGN